MSISQIIALSKPMGTEQISAGTLRYMQTRLRRRIHSILLKEFANSGLTQADLARRLNKDPRLVHRWLSTPENLRLSTLSDLVFAITGGEPSVRIEQPLEQRRTNQTYPAWLSEALDDRKLTMEESSEPATSKEQSFHIGEN